MNDEYSFSSRIKELRESLKLSQSEFAKSVGTTQTTLSSYETTNKTPSLDILKSIAITYNVSLDWLCGLSEKKDLSNTPKTYTDIINILISLKNAPQTNIKFDTKLYDAHSFPPSLYTDVIIEINDKNLVEFYEEWNDILSVCKKSPSGDKLYQIWLKDIFDRYDFPLENASQTLYDGIDEELPFS